MSHAGTTHNKLGWWKSIWTMPGKPGVFLGWPATIFILTQALAGLPLFVYAVLHWHTDDSLRFACFLAVALGASIFKVRLPGIQATMSANFLFVLVGILDLSFPETLFMGCLGGLVQSLWQSKPRPRLIQTEGSSGMCRRVPGRSCGLDIPAMAPTITRRLKADMGSSVTNLARPASRRCLMGSSPN